MGTLGGANGISLVVNLATITLLTHLVSPSTLGTYRYAIAFITGAAVVSQFGLPYAASLRLTRLAGEASRRTIMVVSLLMFTLSMAIGACTMAALLAIDARGANWAGPLILAAPAIFTLTMQVAYINLLNGANEIGSMAIQIAAPPALILLGVTTLHLLNKDPLTYNLLLAVYVFSYLVVHIGTALRFRISICGLVRSELARLIPIARSAGRRVYIGTLFATATTSGLNVVLGALLGMEKFSVFAISYSMAVPVQMIPATIGIVLFKQNATSKRLGARTIQTTMILTGIALLAYILSLMLIFPAVFPQEFQVARSYAIVLAFGSAFLGLGDFFNRFIGAKGRADYLMSGAIVAGLVNVFGTITLALRFGISGAAFGMVLASATYLVTMVIFYRKTVARSPDADVRPPPR